MYQDNYFLPQREYDQSVRRKFEEFSVPILKPTIDWNHTRAEDAGLLCRSGSLWDGYNHIEAVFLRLDTKNMHISLKLKAGINRKNAGKSYQAIDDVWITYEFNGFNDTVRDAAATIVKDYADLGISPVRQLLYSKLKPLYAKR